MALALVAVAANLRIAITSVPPLLDAISADLGLSHAAAGALTTLPVLCMGLFAPVASRIAHRTGAAAAVLGSGHQHPRRHGQPLRRRARRRALRGHVPLRRRHRRGRHPAAAPRQDLLPARARRSRHRPLHARDDGRRGPQLGDRRAARRPARQLAGLARLVVGRRPRRCPRVGAVHGAGQPAPHAGRGGPGPAAVAAPARPGSSPATSPCSRGASTRPSRGSRRPTSSTAGRARRRATSRRSSAGPRSSRACSVRSSATAPATCAGSCGRPRCSGSPAPSGSGSHRSRRRGCGRSSPGSARAPRSPSPSCCSCATPAPRRRAAASPAWRSSSPTASPRSDPLAMGLVRDVTGEPVARLGHPRRDRGRAGLRRPAPAARPAPRRLTRDPGAPTPQSGARGARGSSQLGRNGVQRTICLCRMLAGRADCKETDECCPAPPRCPSRDRDVDRRTTGRLLSGLVVTASSPECPASRPRRRHPRPPSPPPPAPALAAVTGTAPTAISLSVVAGPTRGGTTVDLSGTGVGATTTAWFGSDRRHPHHEGLEHPGPRRHPAHPPRRRQRPRHHPGRHVARLVALDLRLRRRPDRHGPVVAHRHDARRHDGDADRHRALPRERGALRRHHRDRPDPRVGDAAARHGRRRTPPAPSTSASRRRAAPPPWSPPPASPTRAPPVVTPPTVTGLSVAAGPVRGGTVVDPDGHPLHGRDHGHLRRDRRPASPCCRAPSSRVTVTGADRPASSTCASGPPPASRTATPRNALRLRGGPDPHRDLAPPRVPRPVGPP